MSKDFEFEGSGFKGAAFEQKGMEERNLQTLLKSLSNKETQKSIEALSNIERDEWKAMATTATMLNSFVALGSTSELATILTRSIKETVTLQIESILSPLTNEINQQITDILNPFINDILTPLINELNTFLSENSTGAGAGGIIGGIIGAFTPLGPIVGAIAGAIVGALIESGYVALDEAVQATTGFPYSPDVKTLYEQETGNVFTSIYDWNYINWYRNRAPPPETIQSNRFGYQEGF